jgi:hypothetical protein
MTGADLLNPPSPAGQSWRDRIKVHPAAETFDPLPPAELAALGQDIQVHGMTSPIVFWGGEKPRASGDMKAIRAGVEAKLDYKMPLLDGRNRLAAMEAVGILDERTLRTIVENAKLHHGDPYVYVVSANIHRRHLTGEDLAKAIRKIKADRPELSIRGIAEMTGTPKSTVARALDEPVVPNGTPGVSQASTPPEEVAPAPSPPPPAITGRDGKRYPAKKPKRPASRGARLKRANAIIAFSSTLHNQLPETLEDLVRMLRDERGCIADLPLQKRVMLARGYLDALGVSIEDLRPIELAADKKAALASAEPPLAAATPTATAITCSLPTGCRGYSGCKEGGRCLGAAAIKAPGGRA